MAGILRFTWGFTPRRGAAKIRNVIPPSTNTMQLYATPTFTIKDSAFTASILHYVFYHKGERSSLHGRHFAVSTGVHAKTRRSEDTQRHTAQH